MQLKISSISNLTDARFFSAIGAHFLGFTFDALNENNISISKAQEIINWLYQPNIVGEFGIHQTKDEIEFIAQQMNLNEIEIPFLHEEKINLNFEKFLSIGDWTSINEPQHSDFLILKIKELDVQNSKLKQIISTNNVFIETNFTKENILSIVESLQPYGIQISCKKEEKTGLSAVDEYAELLEIIGFS
ncbi:MAG TPA: hypothetical protein PLJ42_01180 [Chitinophagales bacterium]|jgi:phosphoribosylanthranilate isomerase|nr:hypothetical protein [Chitinophagales bacterium]HQV76918.1 hypothetical protein [Chitinophagales bacterium]HQW78015.1 hypothetical protein [Chitinophagales bacterium]HRB18998.1 hypothetical protein [Chitinophagales bacterium]HRB66403.1 hypothetical protein [Chitinophagales bacterium]